MGFTISNNGGGDFRRVPPGVYVSRCYSLIDLGTQRIEYQGDVKMQHKILVRWELFGEDDAGVPLTVDVNGREMPMTISKRYTMSMNDKARLRADLVSWRGRDFTEEEERGFDISKLVGAYCMLNISQSESNGKVYSNVSAITPLPTALKKSKPAPVHDDVLFDIDDPDMGVFATFHERLQETIKSAAEWQETISAPPQQGPVEDLEDIPF